MEMILKRINKMKIKIIPKTKSYIYNDVPVLDNMMVISIRLPLGDDDNDDNAMIRQHRPDSNNNNQPKYVVTMMMTMMKRFRSRVPDYYEWQQQRRIEMNICCCYRLMETFSNINSIINNITMTTHMLVVKFLLKTVHGTIAKITATIRIE